MDKTQILTLLKLDLTISTAAYDQLLNGLIDRAIKAIEREGITLKNDLVADQMIVVQYAAYLWRKRKGEDTGMPRSLRYELNNLYVAQHATATEEG